jgi:hypothetical protein
LLSLLIVACARDAAVPVLGDYQIRIGSPPALLLDQVAPIPHGNAARHGRLVELFAEAGCKRLEKRWRRDSGLPHVVCVLPGRSDETILVSANFDQPPRSGFGDNWSGAAMLPSLYRSIGVDERQHTYEFVGFADESHSRPGSPAASARMVGRLPDEERAAIAALVGIQGLHIDVPAVWKTQADPNLDLDLLSVSRSLHLPVRRINFVVRRGGATRPHEGERTREPLRAPAVDVPSILIGVADAQIGEYLDSFRLVAAYLSYLDQTLEIRKRMRDEPHAAESPASG